MAVLLASAGHRHRLVRQRAKRCAELCPDPDHTHTHTDCDTEVGINWVRGKPIGSNDTNLWNAHRLDLD